MTIKDEIDDYVEHFAEEIRHGFGWIAEEDVYRQFTDMYPGFKEAIFNRAELEKYLIQELTWLCGIEVRKGE